MFVKPREGLKILRPDSRTVLAPVGEHVPKTQFWLRRLRQGDVVEVKERQGPKKVKEEKSVEKVDVKEELKELKPRKKSSKKEETKTPEVE